ncbi:hypothetical protein ACFL20_03480 [Spirochaetota bacterium]
MKKDILRSLFVFAIVFAVFAAVSCKDDEGGNCWEKWDYNRTFTVTYNGTLGDNSTGDVLRAAIYGADDYDQNACLAGEVWAIPANSRCSQFWGFTPGVEQNITLFSPLPEVYLAFFIDLAEHPSSMGAGSIANEHPYTIYDNKTFEVNNSVSTPVVMSETGDITVSFDDTNIFQFSTYCSPPAAK